jgi:hypothetical protein
VQELKNRAVVAAAFSYCNWQFSGRRDKLIIRRIIYCSRNIKKGGEELSKKYKVITTIILILLVLVAGIMLYNREISKRAIYDYIAKQGIKENQLKYTAFHRDYKMGGYFLATYVEGEKPDIYYMYTFRGWDKKVLFQAYYEGSEHIKAQQWGGSGLSDTERKKLKYPPLNE